MPSDGYENSRLYMGFLLKIKVLQGYCKKVAPLLVNVATLLKMSPEVLQYPVQQLHRDSVLSRTSSQVIGIFQRVVNTSGIFSIINLPEGGR